MPFANSITRDDVFSAADEIFATGKNPTQAAIRTKLGRGSFSTINKHLADWRENQTDFEAVASSDQGMSDQELILLRRVYGMVRSSVETAVVTEQVELLERENQELQERQANYDAIAAELAGLKFAYQDAMNRLEQMTRENEQMKQAATKTSTRKPKQPKQQTDNQNPIQVN